MASWEADWGGEVGIDFQDADSYEADAELCEN